nr:transposase (putative), gypsy type [Tanacetum cinerariifolium]
MGRDTVQLETAVSTISQEYLLEFTSEYGISEALHPELPGPEDRIVDFPEGMVGVYTKFFEFANFRLPLSQFLFDILGYYQIHLSQLSVIGAAKVSHFEINCRVFNIIPTLSLFRVFYTPSFNSGWMSFSKRPGKNTPQCYTKPLDSLKNWNNRFFWVDERVFPTVVDWRTSAPKDGMPAENTYSAEAVRTLDTHRTPIQKQPEALLCLVGLNRRYYLGDEVYPTFLHDDDWGGLIRALNPTKVKTGSHPRAAHEVSLLTVTANRVIEMEDPTAATDSSGVPFTIERSPLDFANEAGPEDQETMAPEVPLLEDVSTMRGAPEAGPAERVAATDPPAVKECRKKGHDGVDANAPPKLGMGSTRPTHMPQNAPANVSDPDPLSFADPRSRPPADVAQSSKGAAAAGDPKSENTSFASMVGSPESIYRPEWGITNGSMLDIPEAYQDLVDHVAPPGYFSELRHLHNDDFLRQYNANLARQVAMGSQLRLRFEQEAKLLKKSIAQVARRDKRIQARENEIKNLKALLEAEADMKKAAEDKSVKLSQELEDMRALFSDLQVSNDRLSQQVSTLQEQVSGEEKLKAAFEEFKQYEDNRVEQRCAEMDARLDAISIDFDEELYLHTLTAIAGRRWMTGRGLRLDVMKCGESLELRQAFTDVVSAGITKGMSEGLKHGVEHGQAQLNLDAIEAYDPEAEAKYIAALQALKNLKYPLVDQLEGLKDAPMDVIMAALHLESDTRDDAPQWVRELRPSSFQLTIPVYPEVRDLMDPWACKEEMLLADAIAANVSRAEKKKKCRVVCRTHGVSSAHHARSDGVPVSVPTVVPQGLAILLADAATQTESDEASQLLRSSFLPVMHS